MGNNSATAPRICHWRSWLILSTALLLVIPGVMAAQTRTSPKPTRIKFMRGAISAQVRGRLTSNNNRESFYVVNAQSGDHMIVNIIPITPGFATGGGVTSPSGQGDGQHGGVIFNRDLTETGDYTIGITRNLMATERESGEFILEIVITPPSLKN